MTIGVIDAARSARGAERLRRAPSALIERQKIVHRRLTAALLSLGLLAACGEPAPSPQLVGITTESRPVDACMEALITGVLVPHAEWGLALQTPGTGELYRPVFPFGYRAAVDGAGIVLLDEDGRLVARTGDLIQSSGGFIGGEGNPRVVLCDDTIEVVPGA